MGLVLAKGIVLSLLTVVFFMPAMILRMTPMIEKTSHRSFLPSFDKLSHGIYNSRRIVLILIAVLWPLGLNGLWLNVPGTSLLAMTRSVPARERRYMRMMS